MDDASFHSPGNPFGSENALMNNVNGHAPDALMLIEYVDEISRCTCSLKYCLFTKTLWMRRTATKSI